jgi:hypothetical protein
MRVSGECGRRDPHGSVAAFSVVCGMCVARASDSTASTLPIENPFYSPDPDLFGHPDAYPLFTGFAAGLEEAGLAGRFPRETELRHIAIELLAEGSTVEEVMEDPSMIEDAIAEAQGILDQRQR